MQPKKRLTACSSHVACLAKMLSLCACVCVCHRASSIEPQDVSLLTQLRPLKHLEVYLLHSLTPFSSVLGSLTSAIHLQSCVCNRPFNCSPVKDPGLHASLAM